MPNTPLVQADSPPLLHISVAADVLGLSVYQVKHLIDDGRLASEKVGVRTYIPAESLRAYLASLGQESA